MEIITTEDIESYDINLYIDKGETVALSDLKWSRKIYTFKVLQGYPPSSGQYQSNDWR